jgi:DNA-binding response OmpR family regulator
MNASIRIGILLVDNEPNIVKVFGRELKLKGMQVDVYTSSQEALQSFRPNTYDLAILDIRMPVRYDRLSAIQKNEKCDPSITTCFLSAFEIQADEFKSVFPSMDGVKAIIKKPLSMNELLIEIDPFLKILSAARAASSRIFLFPFEKSASVN